MEREENMGYLHHILCGIYCAIMRTCTKRRNPQVFITVMLGMFFLPACGEAAPVRVTGRISTSVQGSGSGGSGIDSSRIPWSVEEGEPWGIGHTPGSTRLAANSYSNRSYRFDISNEELTLFIDASQVAAEPTSHSIDQIAVSISAELTIEAIKPARYFFGGKYEFESESPGTEFLASMSLTDAASGASIVELQELQEFQTVGALDFDNTATSMGLLEAGRVYDLAWTISFVNPIGGAAVGQTSTPFQFRTIQVPEQGAITSLLALAAVMRLVLSRR